jgi:hypothetical protein
MQQMSPTIWNQWVQNWEDTLVAMQHRGFETKPLVITPPVSRAEVTQIEQNCGVILPEDFVEVVTQYAGSVVLYWHQRNTERFPTPYQGIFSSWGNALWDIRQMENLITKYKQGCPYPKPIKVGDLLWEGRSDLTADEDDVWYYNLYQNKLPLLYVPNGDGIVFDISDTETRNTVLYLQHDDNSFHGKLLGENFIDFMTKWSYLGCPGPEHWQIEPFYDFEKNAIFQEGMSVESWRQLLFG